MNDGVYDGIRGSRYYIDGYTDDNDGDGGYTENKWIKNARTPINSKMKMTAKVHCCIKISAFNSILRQKI